MERTNVCLTKQQVERLKALSKETGLSVSDLIRRAIDAYLPEKPKPKGRPR